MYSVLRVKISIKNLKPNVVENNERVELFVQVVSTTIVYYNIFQNNFVPDQKKIGQLLLAQ